MGTPRKEFTTKSGLTLPLMNLKNKEYLLASDRMLWFVTENERYTIESTFLHFDDEKALCKSTITVINEDGSIKRKADGIKMEHKQHFADYAEKSVTGATARALSYLSYGTQFSGDELNEVVNEKGEEVMRIADAPIEPKVKSTGFKKAPAKEATSGDEWK